MESAFYPQFTLEFTLTKRVYLSHLCTSAGIEDLCVPCCIMMRVGGVCTLSCPHLYVHIRSITPTWLRMHKRDKIMRECIVQFCFCARADAAMVQVCLCVCADAAIVLVSLCVCVRVCACCDTLDIIGMCAACKQCSHSIACEWQGQWEQQWQVEEVKH